jgi:urea carboxylase-associated protein 1
MGNVLFRVIDDTCGRHDTIGGCCSRESNRVRYGVSEGPNCRDNFLRALARHGLGKKDIVANINFFMYVPIGDDGRMAIVDGRSRPGDHVDLEAEMDVLAVLSNCPQINNPANGYNPTPIELIVYAEA